MSLHLLLFWTFFKISLFSIGGGYNMVPLIQHEVETRHWLPPGRFIDMLAVSEATPGPLAVALSLIHIRRSRRRLRCRCRWSPYH